MTNRVDGESLRQVLNYRSALKLGEDALKEVIRKDEHSGGSWYWVRRQSYLIDTIGWEKWMTETEGPKGYGYFIQSRTGSTDR